MNAKIIFILIGINALIVLGMIYVSLNSAILRGTDYSEEKIENTPKLPGKPEPSGKSVMYYKQGLNPNIFSVHRFYLESDTLTSEVFSADGYYRVFGPYIGKEQFLVGNDTSLRVFDATRGEFTEQLPIIVEDGERIVSASLSKGKDAVAYTIDKDVATVSGDMQEVWVYYIATKNNSRLFTETVSLYESLFLAGWGEGGESIVLKKMGGDAGAIWGSILTISARPPYEYKLISSDTHFIQGSLSPDGARWLYSECEGAPNNGDITEAIPCEAGEQLKIYNFATESTETIYRNVSHGNNIYKANLRVIYDSAWKDEDIAVFAIPDGIYEIDIGSEFAETLYRFDDMDPPNARQQDADILHAGENYLIFTRYGFPSTSTLIVDLVSGRVTEFSGPKLDNQDFRGFMEF